jgi:hypothetical protein
VCTIFFCSRILLPENYKNYIFTRFRKKFYNILLIIFHADVKKLRKHKKLKNQKEKQQQQRKEEKPLHEQLKQLKTDADDDANWIAEHGGHVEKPTGAILSLTLGCLILAMVSIVIGCRMRRVTVRRRRHGKAVDADFLVNGMYL